MALNAKILRRHRAAHGGNTSRKVQKGVPNGRCLHQRQEGAYIVYLHPGSGWQRRLIKERWYGPTADERKRVPASALKPRAA